ncbi:MAG: phosphotransferase [Rhodospirillales bacterium]|nr:phosphotransferase [Rhodospirillales bacterium]
MTAREQLVAGFLAAAGWPGVTPAPLAADASFRRYFRLRRDGESAVLMDAPPPQEDLGAFHRVQRLLLDLGLSAPRPIQVDEAAGLMLLEDLGDRTFTRALAEGADEAELYRLAVDLLIELHRHFTPDRAADGALPPYDDGRLLDEALLLTDWYLPALGHAPSAATRDGYVAAWRRVLPLARRVPDSLVLRDYHVDNLMVVEGRRGVASCGLLDFQDAVLGPVSYDLVSLLEDVRRDVPPDLVAEMRARYLAGFPELDAADFGASYAILGAQRNAKIVGIFTRLCRRDGKPHYLGHIPRTWRLLEGDLAHPALAPVKAWFDREIPPARRGVPVAELPA